VHLLWLSYDLELLSERHDECIISYGFHTSWNSPCYRALGATISAFSRTFAKGRWIIKNEQVKNANAKSGGGQKWRGREWSILPRRPEEEIGRLLFVVHPRHFLIKGSGVRISSNDAEVC
jgi:hypothetical protein